MGSLARASAIAFLAWAVLPPPVVGEPIPDDTPYAAGQAIVEFEPGVVNLPVDPGARFIPLDNIQFDLPGLGHRLHGLGMVEFEIIAPFWRRVGSPPPPGEDYVLPHLISFRDVYVLHFPPEHDLATTLDALRELPGIHLVTPNPLMFLPSPGYWPVDTLLTMPSDSSRAYQWDMENTGGTIAGVDCTDGVDIGLRRGYEIQHKCTVKIGLADTGCDSDHDDLEDNLDILLARDFTYGATQWEDTRGHGTWTAGVVGAVHSSDSLGVAGICGFKEPDFSVLVPLKIYEDNVLENGNSTATFLIDALDYVCSCFPTIAITVLEVAIYDGTEDGYVNDEHVAFLRNAVYNAHQTGVFLPAAAGNVPVHHAQHIYPAAFRHLTAGVTAMGCDGSRDPTLWKRSWIDLAAPSCADDGAPDGGGISQVATTAMGGGYAGIEGEPLFGGTSAATPHVGGAAGLLLSHTSSMTNEDLLALMVDTARDMGDTGYDSSYGHGLLRVDSALVQLDRYEFVHDSTDQIDSFTQSASKRLQYFKNIQIVAPTICTPNFFDEDYTEVRADVYEFQTTVSLTQNTSPGHVPLAWARGRRSVAARDTVRYDGYFEPYTAQVVDVTADEAVLLGRTYRLWSPDSTKSYGWYPLRLPLSGGARTIFSFSYLADTATARSAPTPSSRRSTSTLQPSGLHHGKARVAQALGSGELAGDPGHLRSDRAPSSFSLEPGSRARRVARDRMEWSGPQGDAGSRRSVLRAGPAGAGGSPCVACRCLVGGLAQ